MKPDFLRRTICAGIFMRLSLSCLAQNVSDVELVFPELKAIVTTNQAMAFADITVVKEDKSIRPVSL